MLEHPRREATAQYRGVEVGSGGEFFAPVDERLAQFALRRVVLGVVAMGPKRRNARAVGPNGRFKCARARS